MKKERASIMDTNALVFSYILLAIDAERVPALQKFLGALGLLHLTILVQIIVFGMLKSKTNER